MVVQLFLGVAYPSNLHKITTALLDGFEPANLFLLSSWS